jgi:SAM-dependent methyltransferase
MGTIQSDMKRYYEEWWENPLDPRDVIFKELNRVFLKRLPLGAGKRALDVGSGKGTIVSLLRRKGYHVTAVELNENFTKSLRRDFPEVDVVEGDFNSVPINGTFDVVTAIEFVQNFDRETLHEFLGKVSRLTDNLITNISNKNSLHGFWTSFRGFQKPFVYTYTPREIETALEEMGFQVTYGQGIGLLTPITLLSNFRCKIIPIPVAKALNTAGDLVFPKLCHLYYLEANKKRLGKS